MMRIKTGLFLCVVVCLLALAVPAGAVTKTLIITGPQGEPVPNTTISIFAEDGSKVGEAETDDRGMISYNFPGDGNYTVRWEGGSMSVSVSAIAAPIVIGGVVVTPAVIGAVTGSRSPSAGSGSASAGTGSAYAGTYTTNFVPVFDPCLHEITLSLGSGAKSLVVTITGSTITITGPPGFHTVTGTLTGTAFTATGTGDAGIGGLGPDQANMIGTFSGNTWSGTYEYGVLLALPGCPGANPVNYTFTGNK